MLTLVFAIDAAIGFAGMLAWFCAAFMLSLYLIFRPMCWIEGRKYGFKNGFYPWD